MPYLIQLPIVSREDVLVVLLLQGCHGNPDDTFPLRGQASFYFLDDSAEQVRLQLAMQLSDLFSGSINQARTLHGHFAGMLGLEGEGLQDEAWPTASASTL